MLNLSFEDYGLPFIENHNIEISNIWKSDVYLRIPRVQLTRNCSYFWMLFKDRCIFQNLEGARTTNTVNALISNKER